MRGLRGFVIAGMGSLTLFAAPLASSWLSEAAAAPIAHTPSRYSEFGSPKRAMSTTSSDVLTISANAIAVDTASASEAQGTLEIEAPKLDQAGTFSEGKVFITNSATTGINSISAGWIVQAGDPKPYLFAEAFANDNSIGFSVGKSALLPGQMETIKIAQVTTKSGGAWQVMANNKVFVTWGDSRWSTVGETFTDGVVEWGGEVGETSTPFCSQMGNGISGIQTGSAEITHLMVDLKAYTGSFKSRSRDPTLRSIRKRIRSRTEEAAHH